YRGDLPRWRDRLPPPAVAAVMIAALTRRNMRACDEPARLVACITGAVSSFLGHALQRPSIDPEQLGRGGLVVVGVREDLLDVAALEDLERRPVEVDRGGAGL